jgi:hypothetical protein
LDWYGEEKVERFAILWKFQKSEVLKSKCTSAVADEGYRLGGVIQKSQTLRAL